MRRSGAARAALLGLGLAGCGGGESVGPAPLPAGRVGASIAVLGSTGEIAVVNPDQGSVSLLDAATLEPRAEIAVGGEPHALLELASGALLVSTYRGGEVVQLDVVARTVTARRAVCAGPWGLAETPDGRAVVVACEWEGTVLRLDAATLAPVVLARGLSRPRALAAIGEQVIAADFTGGLVHAIARDGATTATSLVPEAAPYRPALAAMSANLAAAIVPAFGRVYVAHELVNHDGNDDVEPVADDYGSVLDGNPKINPAVTGLVPGAGRPAGAADPPVLYARYDGGPRVFNGPAALAAFGTHHLLVANLSTSDVAVLDTDATTPGERAVGSFAVGAGPAGIAVDREGRTAYVDNSFDGSVSRLDLTLPLGPEAPRHAAALTRVRPLAARYSSAALAGRKLFHDAANPQITPSGVVACSTCHPGGGEDGLVWFIHTAHIPLKRRRTPHLAGARGDAAPFHWDGAFATLPALTSATITDLMAGNGLLVDVDAIQAYVDEIVTAPQPPAGDLAAEARGRALFTSTAAACASCHSGPDLDDGALHAVLTPMSLRPDDTLAMANTPALPGLFLRPPYFHDGRAPDLEDLLTRPDANAHGGAATLSPAQRADLIAYLESL